VSKLGLKRPLATPTWTVTVEERNRRGKGKSKGQGKGLPGLDEAEAVEDTEDAAEQEAKQNPGGRAYGDEIMNNLPTPTPTLTPTPDAAGEDAGEDAAEDPAGEDADSTPSPSEEKKFQGFSESPADTPKVELVRHIVGFRQVDPDRNATNILLDSTASMEDLRAVLGPDVVDITPPYRIKTLHPILQVPRDIKIGTSLRKAADILRGILHDLPYRRVGVLTHPHLAQKLPELLGERYASRVRMWDYFRSGRSRGSNVWIESGCDCLIVFGTPRVPVEPIRYHLLRVGKDVAGMLRLKEAGWKKQSWLGLTESGKAVKVRTPRYTDHDWQAAYHSIVVAELWQAIGRARSILPEGIPCYAVTTECLVEDPFDNNGSKHCRIVDSPLEPLRDRQMEVLAALRDERGYWVCRTAAEIAQILRERGVEKCSERRVRQVLGELRKVGRVRKTSYRGGWVLGRKPSIRQYSL
jgi:hypothetical protein